MSGAEEYLALTEENVRSCKLAYLIVKGGRIVLKHRYDTIASSQENFLQKQKPKLFRLIWNNKLTKAQFDLLYPPSGPSSSENYDITLLVALHRTCLSTKKENDPIWHSQPKMNDHSVEADLVRLRDSRNEILHQSMPQLTEAEFNTKWHDVCQVLLRLGNGITGLKDTLENLRMENFDKEYEKQLLSDLEILYKQDKAFGDHLLQTMQDLSPCIIAVEQTRKELANALDDAFFVETSPFKKAKKVLNEKGIVLLIGPIGSGKSTAGIKLVENTNKCLKINKISDWDNLNTSIVDTVFIDDIFGDSKFDKDDSRKWQKILPKIDKYVQSKVLKVIITSRTNVWKEAMHTLTVSSLVNDSNTLTMTSMTNEDKKDILEAHIQINKRTLSQEIVTKCIEATANRRSSLIVGFPECARIFCQRDDLFKQEQAFFESPITHIKNCLSEIFKSNEKVFLAFFVLWAQKPQKLHAVKLEQTFACTPKTILEPIEQIQFRPEKELKTIKVSLLSHSKDFIHFDKRKEIFTFRHPVISDVVGLITYEKNGTAVLKYSHAYFIDRYIRTDDKTGDIENNGLEILLPRSRFDILCATIRDILLEQNGGLIKEESSCTMEVVECTEDAIEAQVEYIKCSPLLYPVFRNRTFCETFFNDVMTDSVVSKILTKPVSSVEGEFVGFEEILDEGICKADICFFVYLVKCSMIEYKDFLSVFYKKMSEVGSQNDTGDNNSLLISLLLAIKHDNLDMVMFLSTLGAPVDDQNVVLSALKMANREIIKFLLQNCNSHKEISNYATKKGKSPLLLFIEEDNVEAVKCILSLMNCTKDDIDVQNEADRNHDSVLHKACTKDHGEIVELMLLKNPNLLSRNVNGFCPIHVAAMAGNTNVVRVLLQHNRKQAEYVVNLSENMQRIKLYHMAVYIQSTDLIDVLEELKISPGCVDDVKQQTPLLFALHEKRSHVVKKLTDLSVKYGVHNNTDCTGNTALDVAIEKLKLLTDTSECVLYQDVISVLRHHVTDLNTQTSESLTIQLAEKEEVTIYERPTSGKNNESQSAQNNQEGEIPTPTKKVKIEQCHTGNL